MYDSYKDQVYSNNLDWSEVYVGIVFAGTIVE